MPASVAADTRLRSATKTVRNARSACLTPLALASDREGAERVAHPAPAMYCMTV